MLPLTQDDFNQIIALLLPSIQTEQDRQTLIGLAFFPGYSTFYYQVNLSGDPLSFATRLVKQLVDNGELDDGKQALVQLLETLARMKAGKTRPKSIPYLPGSGKRQYR